MAGRFGVSGCSDATDDPCNEQAPQDTKAHLRTRPRSSPGGWVKRGIQLDTPYPISSSKIPACHDR